MESQTKCLHCANLDGKVDNNVFTGEKMHDIFQMCLIESRSFGWLAIGERLQYYNEIDMWMKRHETQLAKEMNERKKFSARVQIDRFDVSGEIIDS